MITIAYLTVEVSRELRSSNETLAGEFFVIPRKLAFDRREILRDGLELARKLGIATKIVWQEEN
ncbi:MAG: hypothetical protein QXM73_02060 [Candidatus Nezhaarchaeales archaeon]